MKTYARHRRRPVLEFVGRLVGPKLLLAGLLWLGLR